MVSTRNLFEVGKLVYSLYVLVIREGENGMEEQRYLETFVFLEMRR